MIVEMNDRGWGWIDFPWFDFIEILMWNVIKLKRIDIACALQSSCAWILFNLSYELYFDVLLGKMSDP